VVTVPTGEIGSITALPTWGSMGGTDHPEPPALLPPKDVQTYSRMRTDPQIDSLCNSVTMPVMRLGWRLNPNGARDEVVEQMSTDLGVPIKGSNDPAPRSRRRFKHDDHLAHTLLALWYGNIFFEMVPDTERYDLARDGWRLRKLAPRMPGSIQNIHVAKDGGLEGITQYGYRPPARRRRGLALLGDDAPQIPVDNLAAYVWRREGANWRGRSMLRPLYGPWMLKDRALRVDAIKNERFGAGIPTATAPEGGDPVQYAKMAQAVRAAEAAGVGLPAGASIGVDGIRGTLPDVLASIRYYDESMARAFMAMVIQLGQTQTGSRALGQTFADFFQMLIEAVANWHAAITNEHVIEDIVDWNWSEDEQAPLLEWAYPDDDEPLAVSDLVDMVQAGLITMDAETESLVREKSNLPALPPGFTRPEPADPQPIDATSVTVRKGVRKKTPKITVASGPGSRHPFGEGSRGIRAHLPGKHNQKEHGRGGAASSFATTEEHNASKMLASQKITSAPVPSATAVSKARAELDAAKRGEGRAGGDSRGGSAAARRKQRENLFKEFEAKDAKGNGKGYVVCHVTGLKMHHSKDPSANPNGYPIFERGKIFTKFQGGGYQLTNLLPESFQANRSRNDQAVRAENLAS
jgi:hypothetical protein